MSYPYTIRSSSSGVPPLLLFESSKLKTVWSVKYIITRHFLVRAISLLSRGGFLSIPSHGSVKEPCTGPAATPTSLVLGTVHATVSSPLLKGSRYSSWKPCFGCVPCTEYILKTPTRPSGDPTRNTPNSGIWEKRQYRSFDGTRNSFWRRGCSGRRIQKIGSFRKSL